MKAHQASKLNLGCGGRYRTGSGWENVDYPGWPPAVKTVDLRRPLPYGADRFDFVYTSHVLDHFRLARVRTLIGEIRRSLKPDGVLRISVPDLQQIAQRYLASVGANHDDPLRHEWQTIELLDQLTRNEPGGEKARFLAMARTRPDIQAWLRPLLGHEMLLHLDQVEAVPTWPQRAKATVRRALRPRRRFEDSGERHYWTFDEISLRHLLEGAGFKSVERTCWNRSRFSTFLDENLDAQDGSEYKPGSLYMEAVK